MKASLFISFVLLITFATSSDDFVKVVGNKFYLDGYQYHFLGTNYWYGVNLGAPSSSKSTSDSNLKSSDNDKTRLTQELDQLKSIGVTNLRIMAGGQGPDDRERRIVPSIEPEPLKYNEDVWIGFDVLLDEMNKRGMKAVVPINNYWEWSGGFGQYVEWHGGSFDDPLSFYTMPECQKHFLQFISDMLNRVNTINGRKYSEDPTVMTWQLSNEPRVEDCNMYQTWITTTTEFIKSLAPNHLVSIGNEGTITPCAVEGNQAKGPDYTTFHLWAQNWGWYNPQDPFSYYVTMKKAKEYIDENVKIGEDNGKPVVLEEFGIARDYGSYDPNSNTIIRDLYYGYVFDYALSLITSTRSNLVGVNFWAFGGIGRPRENGGWWKPGDQFIGDPPHERQGWYSVYDKDSTINIIEKFAKQISRVGSDLPKLKLKNGKKEYLEN